jgi:hypothetical protein
MDFFMKSITPAFPSTESDHLEAPGTILRIYELFVRTTYDFEGDSSSHLNTRDDNRTDGPSRAILTSIHEFTGATKKHGVNLLGDSPKHLTQESSVRALFI